MDQLESINPFVLYFDQLNGMCGERKTTKRTLSNMRGMYHDEQAFESLLTEGDPVVYEFYELQLPNTAGDLQFGSSITYPGKVGQEFYMTKGHFHKILDTAEVYYCLSGTGSMMMEDPEGNCASEVLTPGKAVYVPKRWAHRSINTGTIPFVTFFVFRGDAGHDYGTIETRGFRKLLLEKNGEAIIVDNPNWSNNKS